MLPPGPRLTKRTPATRVCSYAARVKSADAAIIGAGPIGIEVHAALKREGLSVLHLDAGAIGATMGWWAPGTRFFSSPERIAVAGVPLTTPNQDKATREEYLQYLRGVVQQFQLEIRTFERVLFIRKGQRGGGAKGRREEAEPFGLRTAGAAGEHEYHAQRVVAAIGDMHRPRMLRVPGEDLPHVSHYPQDPHRYFGRRVLIVGGKNSAVEAAIRLWRVGARVAISYRRQAFDPDRIKYWLLPEIKGLIKGGHIAFHASTVPVEIRPGRVLLAAAPDPPDALFTGKGHTPLAVEQVEADDVLLLTGYEMDASLLEAAGVELVGNQRAPRFDPRTMETNVPGLYVAGTATAGTQQRFRVFIENCHDHAQRIASHILGRAAPQTAEPRPVAALEM